MLISRSFLICLFNITLKGKSTLHISQFARRTIAAIYYTAVRLIKNVLENRETEKNRDFKNFGHSNPVDRRVERANITK